MFQALRCIPSIAPWMKNPRRTLGIALYGIAMTMAAPATHAAASGNAVATADAAAKIALLARDVERAEAIRAVKRLQHSYAQYAQAGLWNEMAALFTTQAEAVYGTDTLRGRNAIGRYFLNTLGAGKAGLPAGGLRTQLASQPRVTLSADGRVARGRWHEFSLLGQYGAGAHWEGTIYENEYARENGVWKIARVNAVPQFAGPYETGWRNVDDDLEIVPYHYDPTSVGIPVPEATGPAPPAVGSAQASAVLATLESRVDVLIDEGAVRNLQNAYGYYIDRKMWDDVTDLFTADGVLEIGGLGVWEGVAGIRRALEIDGPAGLATGQLNNHVQYDTTVTILPGGQEARARGIDLGMLGDVSDNSRAQWSVAAFENRYVKQGGVWRVREMRIFPLMKADYYAGWGKSRIIDPAPTGAHAPTRKAPDEGAMQGAILAFSDPNPASGARISYPAGAKLVGTRALLRAAATARPAPTSGSIDSRIAEVARKLAMAKAYDGAENVSNAFANYIDDFQWDKLGNLMARNGMREMPFAGLYRGPERTTGAEVAMWGPPRDGKTPRTSIPIHLRIQPVIHVAADGRSANIRTRLFSIGSSRASAGSLSGAMYPNDQAVLEDGVWKIWAIGIDEFYFQSTSYQDGWSKPRPRPTEAQLAARPPQPSRLLSAYKPDVLNSDLGEREAGYPGGTGRVVEWPEIKVMWFSYVNPVSGRKPSHYWPDCGSCVAFPQTSMTAHGYLLPTP